MELNKLICVVSGANTGYGECVLSPSVISGAFIVPRDLALTAEDIAALQVTLTALAMDASPKERIYPIHNFEEVADGTEDLVIATLGYGGKYPVRDGDYDWTFRYLQGGLCLSKALRKFSGIGKHILFYDVNGLLIGQKVGDTLKGIPMNFFYSNPWRPTDGSTAPTFAARFSFKPRYINEDVGFVQADFNLATIVGLQDVALKDNGSVRPAMKVNAFVGCAKDNLFDLYSEELSDPAAWVATIAGEEVAITAVAEDVAISGWTITLDTADPNYAVAPAPVVIRLADPEALDALEVTGFESNSVTIIT